MTAATRPTILDAMSAPTCWANWFRDPTTWKSWHALLRATFGLPLDQADLDVFRACTGRTAPPTAGFNEVWLICGRRAGKSFVLALIAVFLAVFKDWRQYLSPGEVGTIKVIACDRRQARVIHRYCRALLTKVPAIAQLVVRDGDDEIELSNNISIEIQTASFRSVRGFTLVAALLDEIAFWRSDETSANPDAEILDAIRPAMSTIPNSMLLCASSPYARRGCMWDAYRRHWAKDDAPALVWKAPTRTMNPTVPQEIIDDAQERDPASAAAEYMAEFRSDIEAFVSREVIDAATMPGRFELPVMKGVIYHGFVDPSGGSSDSMTLAIAHEHPQERGRAVVDAIREVRPPFSPESVVAEFAALLKLYAIREVHGDRYAGEWPRERFSEHGITYVPSEKSKSDIYRELLPALNSGKVELLDHPRLAAQLQSLERRTGRGTGRDIIDHPPGQHDDVANAAAGAVVAAIVEVTSWELLARAAVRRREQAEAAAIASAPPPPPPPIPEQERAQREVVRLDRAAADLEFRRRRDAETHAQLLRAAPRLRMFGR
jgi:hypothetical protein